MVDDKLLTKDYNFNGQLIKNTPHQRLVLATSNASSTSATTVTSYRQRQLTNKENLYSAYATSHEVSEKTNLPLYKSTHLSETTTAMAHIRPSEPSDQPSMLSTVLLSNQLNPTASTQTSNCHISEQQHQRLLQKHGVRSPLQPPLQHPDDQPTLWVFGYGSLLWKTDFAYRSKQIGYIKGYERRFYLGNTTFRGRPGQPGRVANLVEVENGKTWGVAFEVHGREEVAKVLKNLFAREVVSGGYLVMSTSFFPRETCHLRRDSVAESSTDSLSSLADENEISLEQSNTTSRDVEFLSPEATTPIEVILFTVTDNNELYLGPDTMDNMAKQIVKSKGSAGSNVEYVTKTADFVRAHIPEDEDRHLFQLDAKVRELVYQAQTHDVERVRLGLSDISHDLDAYHDRPQAAIVRAS